MKRNKSSNVLMTRKRLFKLAKKFLDEMDDEAFIKHIKDYYQSFLIAEQNGREVSDGKSKG